MIVMTTLKTAVTNIRVLKSHSFNTEIIYLVCEWIYSYCMCACINIYCMYDSLIWNCHLSTMEFNTLWIFVRWTLNKTFHLQNHYWLNISSAGLFCFAVILSLATETPLNNTKKKNYMTQRWLIDPENIIHFTWLTPWFNFRLEWSDHKWTALSAFVPTLALPLSPHVSSVTTWSHSYRKHRHFCL